MIVHPYGTSALLVECAEPETLGVLAQIDHALTPVRSQVAEVVPGIGSIVVRHAPSDQARQRIVAALQQIRDAPPTPRATGELRLDVTYDGADLTRVADELGLSVANVIALHSAATYRVVCCGFAPGFAYLTGLDPALRLPRLASPRPRVPPGAIAIAERYTAIYPAASPGGWNLLGTCDLKLAPFDPERNPPALLQPGMTVRLRATAARTSSDR